MKVSWTPSAAATWNCARWKLPGPCWRPAPRGRNWNALRSGPSLGQCCGGVVYLAFEPVDDGIHAQLHTLRARRQHDSWRVSALDGEPASMLFDTDGKWLAGKPGQAPATFSRERGTHVAQDEHGRRWLVDPCLAPRAHLTLFGAGHVGAAIVRALAHLPCNVTWVDEREDMFPAQLPDNVRIAATDTPEEVCGPGAGRRQFPRHDAQSRAGPAFDGSDHGRAMTPAGSG